METLHIALPFKLLYDLVSIYPTGKMKGILEKKQSHPSNMAFHWKRKDKHRE